MGMKKFPKNEATRYKSTLSSFEITINSNESYNTKVIKLLE